MTFATGGRYSTFLRNLSLRYQGFSVPLTGLGSVLPSLVGHFPQKTCPGGASHPRTHLTTGGKGGEEAKVMWDHDHGSEGPGFVDGVR